MKKRLIIEMEVVIKALFVSLLEGEKNILVNI